MARLFLSGNVESDNVPPGIVALPAPCAVLGNLFVESPSDENGIGSQVSNIWKSSFKRRAGDPLQYIDMITSLLSMLGCNGIPNRVLRESTNSSSPVIENNHDGQPEMGYIEFDDHGELWEPKQLDQVSQAIKQAAAEHEGRVYVVAFVHGWNNSALPDNNNVKSFSALIASLNRAHQEKYNIPIFGVYLGWRGTTNIPKLNFYHRMEGAARVGGASSTEVMYELGAVVKKLHDSNKFVVTGHSMGGRIVESALGQALTADVVRSANGGGAFRPPADLIVLVNPANSSLVSKKIVDALMRHSQAAGNRANPLLVSVTARNDSATNKLFPIGTLIGRVPIFQLFNGTSSGRYRCDYPIEMDSGATQSKAHRTTTGWNTTLHSHTIEDVGQSQREKAIGPQAVIEFLISANLTQKRNSADDQEVTITGAGRVYRMTRKPGYNTSRYWIMQAPKRMINEHNGIWKSDFVVLFSALLNLGMVRLARVFFASEKCDCQCPDCQCLSLIFQPREITGEKSLPRPCCVQAYPL